MTFGTTLVRYSLAGFCSLAHFKVGFETEDGGLAPYKGKNPIPQISKKKNISIKGFSAFFSTTINVFDLFYYNKKQ